MTIWPTALVSARVPDAQRGVSRDESRARGDALPERSEFRVILNAARKGEAWALTAIYVDLAGPVYAYISSRLPDEAEDVTSDTFVAIVARLASFTGDQAAFRSWVFTIAHHRIADHWRRESRRRSTPAASEDLARNASPVNTEADAMNRLGTESALRRIGRLPTAQAEVVLLRVIADMSVEQVAAIVGRRPGAVRALQHRAMRRLAKELAAEPHDLER